MQKFVYPVQIRWADIDANRHLRHSVYYDYAAFSRMAILSESGLTVKKLEEFGIGPILFREEAVFRREILFEDKLVIDVELLKATPNYDRWTIRHNLIKNENTLAAFITIDGAWIDIEKRKLGKPNAFITDVFENFPKANDFQFLMLEKEAS